MKVFIATDHRGIELRDALVEHLKSNEIDILEIDVPNGDLDDYPDYAFKMGRIVMDNKDSLGILICSDGIGMSIAANKVKGIRAVRALHVDDAFKGKNHDFCNILCLGSESLSIEENKEIVDTFILTKKPTEERRFRREDKIIKYESGEYNEL